MENEPIRVTPLPQRVKHVSKRQQRAYRTESQMKSPESNSTIQEESSKAGQRKRTKLRRDLIYKLEKRQKKESNIEETTQNQK